MKKIFSFVLMAAILLPALGFADGGIAPWPGRYVYESDQKAAIVYKDGVEDLFISVTVKGNSEQFAWLVPTPSKPEVSEGPDNLFSELSEYAVQKDTFLEKYMNWFLGYSGDIVTMDSASKKSIGLNATESYVPKVEVVEEKQVGAYDIAVLEADNATVLEKWLNDNGYSATFSKDKVVNDYIKKGWFFTAMKVNQDFQTSAVEDGISTGTIAPVYFRFKTDKMVYPLKISSVTVSTDSLDEEMEVDYDSELYNSSYYGRSIARDYQYQNIDMYIFSDKKYEASNYDGYVSYAEKMSGKKVNKFFEPVKEFQGTYFLTRVNFSAYEVSDFKADMFFREHKDQKELGTGKMTVSQYALTGLIVPASVLYFPLFIGGKVPAVFVLALLAGLVVYIVLLVRMFVNPMRQKKISLIIQTYLLAPAIFIAISTLLTVGFRGLSFEFGENLGEWIIFCVAIGSIVVSVLVTLFLNKLAQRYFLRSGELK
jgi:hypothetical protein